MLYNALHYALQYSKFSGSGLSPSKVFPMKDQQVKSAKMWTINCQHVSIETQKKHSKHCIDNFQFWYAQATQVALLSTNQIYLLTLSQNISRTVPLYFTKYEIWKCTY